MMMKRILSLQTNLIAEQEKFEIGVDKYTTVWYNMIMTNNERENEMNETTKTVYSYSQNNSGGFYCKPAKHIIVVDAKSEEHALEIAKKAGLYLGGVALGSDCDCCGDRWYGTSSEFDNVAEAKAQAEAFDFGSEEVPSYLVTDDLDWDWD